MTVVLEDVQADLEENLKALEENIEMVGAIKTVIDDESEQKAVDVLIAEAKATHEVLKDIFNGLTENTVGLEGDDLSDAIIGIEEDFIKTYSPIATKISQVIMKHASKFLPDSGMEELVELTKEIENMLK